MSGGLNSLKMVVPSCATTALHMHGSELRRAHESLPMRSAEGSCQPWKRLGRKVLVHLTVTSQPEPGKRTG